MKPVLVGNLVGIILALLYFFAAALYSSRVVSAFKMISVPLALGGFVVRLFLVGAVFYGLSKVDGIHFQATLITFVLCFTICTIWKAARSFPRSVKTEGTMHQKPVER